jgi:nitrogen fixation/metabolism regulation signal transduction histidine kinase
LTVTNSYQSFCRLRLAGGKRGAVEIVKPLALIETDIERARLSRLATTLLLLATIFLVVYVVLSRNLSRPILSLLAGARALGEGDLSHRVEVEKNRRRAGATGGGV